MVWIRKRDRRTGVKNKSAKRTGRAVVKPVAKAVQFDPLPDVETLKSVFHYDPETGSLLRLVAKQMPWHRRTNDSTYCRPWAGNYCESSECSFKGKKYRVTRICWKLFYGRDPEGEVSHIDGNPRHNCFENLRDVVKWSQS